MASVITRNFVSEPFEVKRNSAPPALVVHEIRLQPGTRPNFCSVRNGPPKGSGSSALLNSGLYGRMECLAVAPLFLGLSPADRSEMASAARERRLGAKSTLFREGEDVKFVFLIASGWVKTTQLSRSGKEVILRVDSRGDVIDGIGSGHLEVHTFTAETMGDCCVLTWDAKTYLSFVNRFPGLQINASRVLAERLHKLEARFRDLAIEPVTQRLARLLLNLYGQSLGATQDLHIALSCEELAKMTGTTLFTVSRLLSDWQEQEIICRERKTVVVENPAMLIAIAEGR